MGEKTKFEHNHDVVFLMNMSNEQLFRYSFVDESAHPFSEIIIAHGGRDQKSHFFKHSCIKNHLNISKTDFNIISSVFKNTYLRQRSSEELSIKQIKPFLNVQEKSYKDKHQLKYF